MSGAGCRWMSNSDDEAPITESLTPEVVDGYVDPVDPPAAKLKMTADAAEVSALRMLDAADRARKDNGI